MRDLPVRGDFREAVPLPPNAVDVIVLNDEVFVAEQL